MSALEDRQDAAPAIETPAVPLALAPETGTQAEAAIESAELGATAEVDPSEVDFAAAEVAPAATPTAEGLSFEPVATDAAFEPDWASNSLSDRAPAIDEDPPLLDNDLESGIASVFAALHSATHGDATTEGPEPAEADGDTTDTIDLSTFRLLGELDRLWHRAA